MARYIELDALVTEIERRIEELQPCNTRENLRAHGAIAGYYQILSFINSMQEEPVSEDLDEAAEMFIDSLIPTEVDTVTPFAAEYVIGLLNKAIEFGANWQKENLWKSADGDDLPEYDREVIAILDYDFGHYKVVYAHRPNPNGWNGTNIDTGEKEHFEPEIYDKGGWNQPHVLYWLDTRLPYEKNINGGLTYDYDCT